MYLYIVPASLFRITAGCGSLPPIHGDPLVNTHCGHVESWLGVILRLSNSQYTGAGTELGLGMRLLST